MVLADGVTAVCFLLFIVPPMKACQKMKSKSQKNKEKIAGILAYFKIF